MNDLHGIIFAYHSLRNLGDLTNHRNTCSVPYGSRYRLIDFMLSNMVNAGVSDIGLIVHENYQSLLDHVGSGKDWDLSRKHGGLRILPPFSTSERTQGEYRGNMDALVGVSSYLRNIRQDYVVLAWGDLAINFSLEEAFAQHLETQSDITVVCTNNRWGAPEVCQYLKTDGSGRVTDIIINPSQVPDGLESLEIYILSKSLLLSLVEECATHDMHSFSRGALLPRLNTLKITPYLYDGYVGRFHSVRNYFVRSMDLLKEDVRRDVFDPNSPVRTKDRFDPSTYYGPDSRCHNSLIADGCVIEGEVENSILFRGVVVEKGAKVSNCVLMQGTVIGADANVSYAVADKNVRIGEKRTLTGQETYPIAIPKNTAV
ncbi:MAG: glucose-1-phosphate adenylyltransferase subunit GlgD [Ruminococcaceae bacterium]|nr:glucose-1-phosphate adenylyltransferase subunit GlgD [Oscillospiraceae bacterium]